MELRGLAVSAEGSQFRSRDVFPPAFAKIARGDRSDIRDALQGIPNAPSEAVCYTDGYGNLKTTVDFSKFTLGTDVLVSLNGHAVKAKVVEGIFGVADGGFCISQGSSGWVDASGKPRRMTEIVRRGGNAAAAFGNPPGGAVVEWNVLG